MLSCCVTALTACSHADEFSIYIFKDWPCIFMHSKLKTVRFPHASILHGIVPPCSQCTVISV